MKGIFDHFSPLVEASKKNILEWHLSFWQFPGRHSWIMTLTRTARAQLPNIYSQGKVAQESWCVSWSLPGPAGRLEKLPSYKLALCQGGFLGQEWTGSGLCQSGRRRANWLSSQVVVPSWQQWSGHSRSALAHGPGPSCLAARFPAASGEAKWLHNFLSRPERTHCVLLLSKTLIC